VAPADISGAGLGKNKSRAIMGGVDKHLFICFFSRSETFRRLLRSFTPIPSLLLLHFVLGVGKYIQLVSRVFCQLLPVVLHIIMKYLLQENLTKKLDYNTVSVREDGNVYWNLITQNQKFILRVLVKKL
jgi:hypothetical protein